MEGQAVGKTAQCGRWRDLVLVLVLLASAAGLRGWHLRHTEVAARDSIGYIRYAWQLKHQPWKEVLHRTEQPPAYALMVLGTSLPVRHLSHASDAIAMQLSAQLVSALAGVLLVVPMFLLGREVFGR